MSTQKRKFELFSRLQELGFTYEEALLADSKKKGLPFNRGKPILSSL